MNDELESAIKLADSLCQKIIDECKISRVTLWNWRKGNTPVPFWAKEKINLITVEMLGKAVFLGEN